MKSPFKPLVLILLFAGLVPTATFAGEPGYTNVDNAALKVLVDDGVKIVDVRRPDEWRTTGVIPGSALLTAFDASGRFNPDFPAAFEALVNRDESVVLICQSGGRSTALARALSEQAGYTRIYNVAGGIAGWMEGGNPTVPCSQC
jgi:rhodanese-related sulfurtransferase